MHTVPPPLPCLEEWLKPYPSTKGRYGHLLLEQKIPTDDVIRLGLTPYFESAHLDARICFHEFAQISLHPDEGQPGCNARYPNSLPPITRRGLFGEVMSGLMTEAYEFIGAHEWIVPVFLLREHEDARQYLFQLARAPERTREVQGRKGDDFIALVINDEGEVTRFIAGEAKWRATWTPSVVDTVMLGDTVPHPETKKAYKDADGKTVRDGKGVWFEINRALPVPIGLKQLQQILVECAKDEFETVIESLDQILMIQNPQPVERTDLVFLIGDGPAKRDAGETLLEWQDMPSEYTAGRDLQVVEVIISNGGELIDTLYEGLWPEAEGGDE